MTEEKRFHPFMALRFLRKTLAVYLLPLIHVLFARNWDTLWTALRQDAVIFLVMAGISWVILHASSWSLDAGGVLHLHWRLFYHLDRAIPGEALAALTLERPVLFRLSGASRVVLYPIGQPQKRVLSLCLEKEDALELADRLLPIRNPTRHRPGGGERLGLVLLGANGISTLTLLVLAVRQTRQLPQDAQTLAFAQFHVLTAFAARWLPAGAAWLLAVAATLFGASLLRSFAQTVHYEVWRTEIQIGSITVRRLAILTPVLTILLVIALVLLIKHTKMGMAMRAVAKDFDTAQLMGIRIDRIISFTFIIGSFLAAVGSILYFSYIGQVSPTIGAMPGLKSFVAAVFGGIGSVPGAVIGSYIIGICETFIKSNQDISIFSNAFTFALLIIILLIKPNGLFGEKLKEKV